MSLTCWIKFDGRHFFLVGIETVDEKNLSYIFDTTDSATTLTGSVNNGTYLRLVNEAGVLISN